MEVLPVELRQTILQILDLESLKSIRLASKAWAFLAEEYLISPSFTTLPHRDDMSRLLAISQHPNFCFRIQNCKLTCFRLYWDPEVIWSIHCSFNSYVPMIKLILYDRLVEVAKADFLIYFE